MIKISLPFSRPCNCPDIHPACLADNPDPDTNGQSVCRRLRHSILAIFTAVFLTSCGGSGNNSPFDDILSGQPFAVLTDSIGQNPKRDDLYFRRAVLLHTNNYPEPALADLQKAWSIRKDQKYAMAIATIWQEKRPDSAIIFLNQALKELPHSYLLKLTLARTYSSVGKTIDALKICDQLLSTYPNQTEVFLLQSELLEKRGDTLRSIVALERAYKAAPRNLEIGLTLAYRYAETKNSKVLALCDTLIKRDSLKLFADPYYVKGDYYANINDKARAIHFFDETIRRNYNYLNAYIEKGKILLDQKKIRDAYKVFKLSNTIDPAFPDAYYYMGRCEEALGQKEEAKLSYEKAFGLDKSFTEAKESADRLGK
jgi:tetratricopeptide (TPR) repeat protein